MAQKFMVIGVIVLLIALSNASRMQFEGKKSATKTTYASESNVLDGITADVPFKFDKVKHTDLTTPIACPVDYKACSSKVKRACVKTSLDKVTLYGNRYFFQTPHHIDEKTGDEVMDDVELECVDADVIISHALLGNSSALRESSSKTGAFSEFQADHTYIGIVARTFNENGVADAEIYRYWERDYMGKTAVHAAEKISEMSTKKVKYYGLIQKDKVITEEELKNAANDSTSWKKKPQKDKVITEEKSTNAVDEEELKIAADDSTSWKKTLVKFILLGVVLGIIGGFMYFFLYHNDEGHDEHEVYDEM